MWLLIFDLKGATVMPRYFYKRLDKLMKEQPVRRIQFSVYQAESEEAKDELYLLGKKYGFEVRVFKVEKEV